MLTWTECIIEWTKNNNHNGIFECLNEWIIQHRWSDKQSTSFTQNQYLWLCYKYIHFTIEYLYMISFLHVWLIDRFTYCVNQRIIQLIYEWINDTLSCSKYQFKYYFSQPTNWYSATMISYVLIFFQSIICWCFWLIQEWLEDWIDAYCASYFYYQSNKPQCK